MAEEQEKKEEQEESILRKRNRVMELGKRKNEKKL